MINEREDPARVREGYELAFACHDGQMRGSGEPYIIHPMAVAEIVHHWGVDDDIVIAAYLHDTVEDTDCTLQDIEQKFGKRVAHIVDGVTKITHFRRETRDALDAKAETIRKIILGMSVDLGIILVKLADRLHNMRTLHGLSIDRQRKMATETMNIYAPIAHRLGMHLLQSELEDLAFAVLHPQEFEKMQELLSTTKIDRASRLKEVGDALVNLLSQNGVEATVTGRVKHTYSIWRKMQRENTELLPHDLIGLRIIIPDRIRDCYLVLGLVHSLWGPIPGLFDDYIANPKVNGYQSLHTSVRAHGKPLEVQIRTQSMHRDAEFGIAAHYTYKEPLPEAGDPTLRAAEIARSYRKQWVQGLPQEKSKSFMEELLEHLHTDEIHAVTPKGQAVALPIGATPIDFAYAVHTDLGNSILSCRINGNIVPLGTKIKNGDTVEIIAGGHPSDDWLAMCITARARSAIRKYVTREKSKQSAQKGRQSLIREATKLGIQELVQGSILPPVAKELGYEKSSDLYAALGERKIKTGTVIKRLIAASEHELTGVREVVYLQGWDRAGILGDVGEIIAQADGNIVSHHGYSSAGGFILELTVAFKDRAPEDLLAHLRGIHGVWDAWLADI